MRRLYNNIDYLHNNITSICIPYGPKYTAKFYMENNNPQCILYDETNKIHKNIYCSYNPILCLGTTLYGTVLNNTFICEDIIYYKNKKINIHLKKKINLIEYILDNYINECNSKHVYNFKLPYMTNREPFLEISNLTYYIHSILQVKYNPSIFLLSNLFGYFVIKKHPYKYELYELYTKNNDDISFYDNAYINDIKTNYFVRKLFNNKKHYKNIEYSDDEDNEIQTINERNIICLYIPSNKKWKPYKINKSKHIDSIKKIIYIEKKNYIT